MRRQRDFRGLTALVLALGVQANLMTLILTERVGSTDIENTIMATIFGAALAIISAYVAGGRSQQPADSAVAASAEPATAPAPRAPVQAPALATAPVRTAPPRRAPTGDTPAAQGTVPASPWPPPAPPREARNADPQRPNWPDGTGGNDHRP